MRSILCFGACVADCPHGVACEYGALGVRIEHPIRRGRPLHLGDDGRSHEWVGKGTAGCTVTDWPTDDPADADITLTVS